MSSPEAALAALTTQLREEESVISPHVSDADPHAAALGLLAAAGPRAADQPAEYALLIETIREGFLLHYGRPRVVVGADPELALLAGDYLYARGLERLAALGDLEAVRELSDLISLSAQLHAEGRPGSDQLWLASVTAVATGADPAHQEAKSALGRAESRAPEALWEAAVRSAGVADIGDRLEGAAESIGFEPH
jgi:hypothetical protein